MNPPGQQSGGIRFQLQNLVPNWLSNRKGLNVGYRILWVIAFMCDLCIEALLQGLRGAWPGKGTPTASDLLAQSRGLIRGPNESWAAFAARLQGWIQAWFNAGSDAQLLRELQAYIPGNPCAMRLITRAGHFTSIDVHGNITTATDLLWNWDQVSNPERNVNGAPWWSDLWLVVYGPNYLTYSSFSDTNWIAAWTAANANPATAASLEPAVPRADVNNILRIIRSWKGAHAYVEAIIWSYNTAVFVPGSLGGVPDGTWGNWSYCATPSSSHEPARLQSASGDPIRYWTPAGGG